MSLGIPFFETILYRWKIVEKLLDSNINFKSKFLFFINDPIHSIMITLLKM